jgi:ABC-2 type transport system permease protein
MENRLAMPVRPLEIIIAEIVPQIGVGYLQARLVIVISALVFDGADHGTDGVRSR